MSTQHARTGHRAQLSVDETRKNLLKLKSKMRGLRNHMDYIEILSNFWPLPNMEDRISRLESEMAYLNHAYSDGVRQLKEHLGQHQTRQQQQEQAARQLFRPTQTV